MYLINFLGAKTHFIPRSSPEPLSPRRLYRCFSFACLAAGICCSSPQTLADELKIAVASNFSGAIKQLAPQFKAATGHTLVPSFGSTGQLKEQIKNAAPFEVFLAADDKAPQELIQAGLAEADSHFIYANGRLALWSNKTNYVDSQGNILRTGTFNKLAIANFKTAPYGQAAIETLTSLGMLEVLQKKFVVGENITQTQQFIATGNAELGFIAYAQVLALPVTERGSFWLLPGKYHQPIAQGAVIISNAKHKDLAKQFLQFLRSPNVLVSLQELGYETRDNTVK